MPKLTELDKAVKAVRKAHPKVTTLSAKFDLADPTNKNYSDLLVKFHTSTQELSDSIGRLRDEMENTQEAEA